jgi:hypothetical protein
VFVRRGLVLFSTIGHYMRFAQMLASSPLFAAKNYYWVDPREELAGLFMTQYMTGVQSPERDMRSLTYQAIID